MKIEERHGFTVEEAQQRLKLLMDGIHRQYGTTTNVVVVVWDGPKVAIKGKAAGVTIDATAVVEPDRILLEGKDPGFLLRGMVTGFLKKKLAEYLDPRVPIEHLSAKE